MRVGRAVVVGIAIVVAIREVRRRRHRAQPEVVPRIKRIRYLQEVTFFLVLSEHTPAHPESSQE